MQNCCDLFSAKVQGGWGSLIAVLHHFEAIKVKLGQRNAERTDAWTGRRVGGSSAHLVALRL